MRCTACDAELILTNVLPDDTVAVGRVERHTFVCPACHTTECRVVFTRHGREYDEPLPFGAVPRIKRASATQDEHVVAPGFFSRVIARLRGQ